MSDSACCVTRSLLFSDRLPVIVNFVPAIIEHNIPCDPLTEIYGDRRCTQ